MIYLHSVIQCSPSGLAMAVLGRVSIKGKKEIDERRAREAVTKVQDSICGCFMVVGAFHLIPSLSAFTNKRFVPSTILNTT